MSDRVVAGEQSSSPKIADPTLTESKDQDVDDSNQYEEYSTHLEEPTQPRMSFPISEKSKECCEFNDKFADILHYLRENATGWQSIECIGRLHDSEGKGKKIRSTVVIGFSKLPENRQTLKQGLQSKVLLPIEFVEGGYVELSHYGFKGLQCPLVCGASCGILRQHGTGTMGGFVTIKGDPDPGAVYAVTNHHVVSNHDDEAIQWADKKNLAKHLGIDEAAHEDLKALCGENVMNLGRDEINKILELLDILPSLSNPDNTESYIRELVTQFFPLWQQHGGDIGSNGIDDLVGKCLKRLKRVVITETSYFRFLKFTGSPNFLKRLDLFERFERLEHLKHPDCSELHEHLGHLESDGIYELFQSLKGIQATEGFYNLESLKPGTPDLRELYGRDKFWTQHCGLLSAEASNKSGLFVCALIVLIELIQKSYESTPDALLILLRRRRLSRNLKELKNVVEHPSRVDRKDMIDRLEKEITESETYKKDWESSGEVVDHSGDIETLENDLRRARDHDLNTNADRLIGIVWASSGKHSVEPKHPKVADVKDAKADWALVKLFPGIKGGTQNSFSSNILRPRQPSQQFIRVRQWPRLSNFQVSKRGRTTDYTIGEVNGSIGVGKCDSDGPPVLWYSIVSKSTNGSFARKGDSGSWIMDKDGQLVGMVYGRNTTTDNVLFTPAQCLFNWIEEAFVDAMKTQGVQPQDEKRGERVNIFRIR